MSQIVKFCNTSGERISLYREDGSIFKIIENVGWNRDPAGGTLRTGIISQHENPVPDQEEAYWIDEVDFVWNDCPNTHPYAPFKKITFLKGNQIKLTRRNFWRLPEMDWPVVTFLFESPKIKFMKDRLEPTFSSEPIIFLVHIPTRVSVDPLSKYAKYRNWFFCEQPMKKVSPKQIGTTEIVQFGERLRGRKELEKIEELRAEAEEREKAKLV